MIKHTLKAANDAGATRVAVYCISCCHSKAYTLEHALELWGTDATFPEIARRSKCRQCKRQASQAAPEWPHVHGLESAPQEVPPEWRDLQTHNFARFPMQWPKSG